MQEHEQHMIDTLARQVLYSEKPQDFLIEKIWELWTPEEKQALADRAHELALERLNEIVRSKLSGYARPNAVSQAITARIKAALDRPEITAKIKDYGDKAVEVTLEAIPQILNNVTTEYVRRVLDDALGSHGSQVARRIAALLPKETTTT